MEQTASRWFILSTVFLFKVKNSTLVTKQNKYFFITVFMTNIFFLIALLRATLDKCLRGNSAKSLGMFLICSPNWFEKTGGGVEVVRCNQ